MTVYLGSAEDVIDHPVLPCLEASIPRWESLRVDVPRTFLQCLSGNIFSNLRTLTFYPHWEFEWHLDLDIFQPMRVPALHEFRVDTWSPFGAPLESVALPWAQLTRVFNILVDTDALDYLAKMTNVQELEVVLSDIYYTPSERVISLPKLRRLSILEDKRAAPGYVTGFFSTLTIPSISELELKFIEEHHLCVFPTSQLVKLDITYPTSLHNDNTSNLLDFLSLTHRVEQLRIYAVSMPVDLLTGLTFSNSSSASSRLPCLRILDIRECACDDVLADDISPIFDMLESRMAHLLEEKNFTQDVSPSQLDSGRPMSHWRRDRVSVAPVCGQYGFRVGCILKTVGAGSIYAVFWK
ncbi:hypothetical protein BDZ89DRAFT_392629 [Hymenopellis radicata]|nr:hypothetical protein BDZ89DRAFT_392629 [Hymenopellis radicata]